MLFLTAATERVRMANTIDFSLTSNDNGSPGLLQMIGRILPVELKKKVKNIEFKWILTVHFDDEIPFLKVTYTNDLPIRWSVRFWITNNIQQASFVYQSKSTATCFLQHNLTNLSRLNALVIRLTFDASVNLLQPVKISGLSLHSEALCNLLKSGIFSDAIIRLDSDTEIQVHKAILAAHSPYFAKIFRKKQWTTEEYEYPSYEGIYEVNNLTDHTMRQVLQFVYTGQLDEMAEMCLVPLYTAASELDIENLKKVCHDAINADLTVDQALEYLKVVNYCEATDLRNMLIGFLLKNWDRGQLNLASLYGM